MTDLLKRIGWSQIYFADHIGVDVRTVYNWCHKEPSPCAMRYLNVVARFLDV